jgi:hypothetical protein
LPGSEDHQKLYRAGTPLDPDLNKYDLNHATTAHGRMSKAEWDRCYALAWDRYYTIDHVETMLRRAAATGLSTANILFLATWFVGSIKIEKVHPLEGGALRLKFRGARRPELGIESPLVFYPRYWGETAVKIAQWALLYLKFGWRFLKIERDPAKEAYTDLALTPVSDHEEELEMFRSDAAQAYLSQERRLEKARHGGVESPAAN